MGMSGGASSEETKELGKVITYVMEPLTDEKWGEIKEVIEGEGKGCEPSGVKSETTSVNDVATKVFGGEVEGIVVDANRELRAKFYTGQVGLFMSWFASLTQALDSGRSSWAGCGSYLRSTLPKKRRRNSGSLRGKSWTFHLEWGVISLTLRLRWSEWMKG